LGLIFALCFAREAPAQDLRVTAYSEGTRIDPSNGRAIEGGRPVHTVRLRGARDEVLAFQLRVEGNAGTYRIATSSLAKDLRAEIFLERPVWVAERSDSPHVDSFGAANYPDILIPTSTITVPEAPGVVMLWVDLFIPRDTPAGFYSSSIEFIRDEASDAMIAFQVEVLPLTLPARDIARLGAVNFGSFLEREKKDPQHLLRWMQLAHAHHLTVELMKPVPPIDSTGVIDWDRWSARFSSFIDGTAFTGAYGYRGPREGLPVTRFVAPLSEHWPSPRDESGFLPSDGALWSKTLRELERYIEKKGWRSVSEATEWILFMNSLDEPKKPEEMEAIKAYGPLIEAAQLEERSHFSFRVDGVLGIRIEGWPDKRKLEELGPVVDIWNLHGSKNTAPVQLLEDRRLLGERWQFYASSSGGEPAIPPLVVDSTIAGARAWAWIVARYRMDGALNWEIDFTAGCVENVRCSEGHVLALDALLAYRGHEVGRADEEPIASMRLKALRRGAQDVALLSLLAQSDAARSRRIAERLIPRALGESWRNTGQGTWSRVQDTYEEARQEILDELTGQGPNSGIRPMPWELISLGFVMAFAYVGWRILVGRRAP
jgi:hypothetical protein